MENCKTFNSPDMELLDKLVEIIGQETEAYRNMLELSREKTGYIIDGNMAKLEGLLKLEQSIVLQVRKLESARQQVVERLADQFGVEEAGVTMSGLLQLIGSEWSQRLKACRDKLAAILSELRNVNELNSKLIRNSLEYIDFSLNLFASIGADCNNYGNTGTTASSGKKKSFFDVKL